MRRTVVFDDLDGVSEASETVTFAVNGDHYTIDLSEEHAKEFLAFVDPYIQAGQEYVPAKAPSPKPSMSKEERASIVEWAAGEGIQIAPRGRIAAELVDRFKAAQSSEDHATVEAIEKAMEAGKASTEAPVEEPAEPVVATSPRRQRSKS